MIDGLIGLLIGVFCGLALRPVLDAFVLWRSAHELNAEYTRSVSSEEADR